MRRIMPVAWFLLLVLFLFIPNTFAMSYTVDGKVSDWGIDLSAASSDGYLNTVAPKSPTADYVREDSVTRHNGYYGYVGPGYGGQTFDIEAMYFDNDSTTGYLAIITGFPLGGADRFGPGDLGIDVSPATAGVNSDWNNSTIYELGISLDDSTLYDVNTWQGVKYDSNPQPNYAQFSDPWKIENGRKISPVNFAYSSTPINKHYVYEFSFLLSDLGLKEGGHVNFHWTMECGNDVLNLPATVAPEPATMILLGIGMLGFGAIGRKKFPKSEKVT